MDSDSKTQIMRQVQTEAAMQNARMLVEVRPASTALVLGPLQYTRWLCPQKLNEHCFERCVPKPGTSLSKGEEGCFTACMEKYMGAWNTVSKQYVARIQREAQNGVQM
jgi:import inner membrane translocase subunit TIM13